MIQNTKEFLRNSNIINARKKKSLKQDRKYPLTTV